MACCVPVVSEYQLAVPSKATRGRLGGVDRDRCVRSTVTTSLPVTCPLQHLHQWQRHDDDDKGQDNISEFKQGQLKVLMMEGVVYRLVFTCVSELTSVPCLSYPLIPN